MNPRIVLVLARATLRQILPILPSMLIIGFSGIIWLPFAVLSPPMRPDVRVGVQAPDVPEVLDTLKRKGFTVSPIPPGEDAAPGARGLDVTISLRTRGGKLPRVATIAFADAANNISLDVMVRHALNDASDSYAVRLRREAGLTSEADRPIVTLIDEATPLTPVYSTIFAVMDLNRFVPPRMLAACLALALFGMVPVLFEGFQAPRYAGRFEAFFPVAIRPIEIVAGLVAAQAAVGIAFCALAVGILTGIAYAGGFVVAAGLTGAAIAALVVSACFLPFILAAATLFRRPALSMLAAGLMAAALTAMAYVPTVAIALGAQASAFAAWPVHGLVSGGTPWETLLSLAATLALGALGFSFARRRADGRSYLRIDV